jgi:hypothetical protein
MPTAGSPTRAPSANPAAPQRPCAACTTGLPTPYAASPTTTPGADSPRDRAGDHRHARDVDDRHRAAVRPVAVGARRSRRGRRDRRPRRRSRTSGVEPCPTIARGSPGRKRRRPSPWRPRTARRGSERGVGRVDDAGLAPRAVDHGHRAPATVAADAVEVRRARVLGSARCRCRPAAPHETARRCRWPRCPRRPRCRDRSPPSAHVRRAGCGRARPAAGVGVSAPGGIGGMKSPARIATEPAIPDAPSLPSTGGGAGRARRGRGGAGGDRQEESGYGEAGHPDLYGPRPPPVYAAGSSTPTCDP